MPPFRLNQDIGCCVGCGLTNELASSPKPVGLPLSATIPDPLTWAKLQVYAPAQVLDPWPDTYYPDGTEGTSVLAGLQVVRKILRLIDGFEWATTIDDIARGVGYRGPCVIGVSWSEDMFEPDSGGFIHPTGPYAGGHCCLIFGVKINKTASGAVDWDRSFFKILNSWGPHWGVGGTCYMSFTDTAQLLAWGGEFAFVTGRRLTAGPPLAEVA
jgi:hypothetical protein